MFFNLQRCLRATAFVASSAAAMLAGTAAQAVPIYDNLAASQVGSDPVFSYGPVANSFTTGADGAAYLSGVKALLTNGSPSVVGRIQVSLHADGVSAPGAELASLGSLSSADVATGSFAAYSFAPAAGFLLAANTTYWIEIASVSPNDIFWSWSDDLLALGVAGQSNYSAVLGLNANSASFGPYQMAVEVPEPGSIALVFLGLALAGVVSSRRRPRQD